MSLLKVALDASLSGMALTNGRGEIIWVNGAMTTLTGFEPDELPGKTPAFFRPENGDSDGYESALQAIADGQYWRGEVMSRRKNGDVYAEELIVTPLRETPDRVSHLIVIKNDISEWRKHVQDLEIKNAFLERAEELARVGYWRVSLPSGDLDWSDEIYRIHGVDKDTFELTVENAINAYHPEDRDRVAAAVSRGIEHGENFAFELRIVRPNGEIRYVAAKSECHKDERGAVTALFGVFMDVTDAREYEQLLLLAREELREANEFKNSLLANVTHELRTPLTAILGFADLLESEAPPELHEFVSSISFGGRRLLSTLDSVIDYSSIESGRGHVVVNDLTDIGAEISIVVKSFLPAATHKNVGLRAALPQEKLEAVLDRRYLRRILEALVDNAVKFTESGSITVTLRDPAGANGNIEIEVRDTGIGITEDFLPDLFESFKQASTGHSRTHEGVGLGLTISKHLVSLMGGSIRVDTQSGVGSSFTVVLPERADNRSFLKRRSKSRTKLNHAH